MVRRITLHFVFLSVLTGPCFGQSLDIQTSRSLFEAREFEKAKALLSKASRSDGEFAEAMYLLGRIAVEEKAYELSAERFESAVQAAPNRAEYHNWLGVMYGVVALDANPLKQAYLAPKIKHEFEKAAALEPDNLQTQWGLVNYYCKAPALLGGSWEKALTSAHIIGRHDRPQGLRALAFVHIEQKKFDLAEKELMEALEISPLDSQNTFALARFYEDRRMYDKARTYYESSLRLLPGLKEARERLSRLN